MKKFLFLFLIPCLLGFTWQGELNPNDFDKWPVISVNPTPQDLIWMFVKNPDQTSSIDIVAMVIDSDFILYGYRYFKDGEPYIYVFDGSQGKEGAYIRHELTQEERKSCMECHQDKAISKISI